MSDSCCPNVWLMAPAVDQGPPFCAGPVPPGGNAWPEQTLAHASAGSCRSHIRSCRCFHIDCSIPIGIVRGRSTAPLRLPAAVLAGPGRCDTQHRDQRSLGPLFDRAVQALARCPLTVAADRNAQRCHSTRVGSYGAIGSASFFGIGDQRTGYARRASTFAFVVDGRTLVGRHYISMTPENLMVTSET